MMRQLLNELFVRVCIDMDRVVLMGQSNGGMFVHRLVQELPAGTFRAIVPVFGLPPVGYLVGQRCVSGMHALARFRTRTHARAHARTHALTHARTHARTHAYKHSCLVAQRCYVPINAGR